MALPNVDPDKAWCAELVLEEQTLTTPFVCMQCALLCDVHLRSSNGSFSYTTSAGERRIRVHTINVPVVNALPDLFASIDADTSMNVLARMGAPLHPSPVTPPLQLFRTLTPPACMMFESRRKNASFRLCDHSAPGRRQPCPRASRCSLF